MYVQRPHFTNRGVPGPASAGCVTYPSVSISPWQRVAIQPHIMTGIAPVLPYHGTNLLISSPIILAYSYLHLYIHHLHYCYRLSIQMHSFYLSLVCAQVNSALRCLAVFFCKWLNTDIQWSPVCKLKVHQILLQLLLLHLEVEMLMIVDVHIMKAEASRVYPEHYSPDYLTITTRLCFCS